MGGKQPDKEADPFLTENKTPTDGDTEDNVISLRPGKEGRVLTWSQEGVLAASKATLAALKDRNPEIIETDEDPPTNPGEKVHSLMEAQRVAAEQGGRVTMDARGLPIVREGAEAGKGKVVVGRIGDPQEDPDDPFEDGEDNTLEPQKGKGLMGELRRLAERLRRWFVGEPQR